VDEDAIARHFELVGVDDVAAAEIYADDAALEYVQSGERIRGRAAIIASRQAYPGRPTSFEVRRCILGGATFTVELLMHMGDEPHAVVAILDVRDDLVWRERIYIAEPWDPPAYRAQWVEHFDDTPWVT
jgi:hypothetical protein